MAITGYNHVCCIGAVANGPWHRPGAHGKAESASFTLAVSEMSRDGQEYKTFIPCMAYGKQVRAALALRKGDAVLCEGKISWVKGREGKSGLAIKPGQHLVYASSDLSRLDILALSRNPPVDF